MADTDLGLIGYGEVGGIFGAGLQRSVRRVCAWDTRLTDAMRARAAQDGVRLCDSAAQLQQHCDFVISAVTAANAVAAAQQAAAALRPGTVFLDLNSASPDAKRDASARVEAAGGVYVDAGVMSSVPPHGIRVPMLLSGPQANAVAARLRQWGLDATAVADTVGTASAIKMCRSVMIKGLEALVIESFSTARAYGVEDRVLASLQASFPAMDWPRQGAYFFSRVVQHGRRRAEEMREVARTVAAKGQAPLMASATADKQDRVADLAARGVFDGLDAQSTWQEYADRVLVQRRGSDSGSAGAPDPERTTP